MCMYVPDTTQHGECCRHAHRPCTQDRLLPVAASRQHSCSITAQYMTSSQIQQEVKQYATNPARSKAIRHQRNQSAHAQRAIRNYQDCSAGMSAAMRTVAAMLPQTQPVLRFEALRNIPSSAQVVRATCPGTCWRVNGLARKTEVHRDLRLTDKVLKGVNTMLRMYTEYSQDETKCETTKHVLPLPNHKPPASKCTLAYHTMIAVKATAQQCSNGMRCAQAA